MVPEAGTIGDSRRNRRFFRRLFVVFLFMVAGALPSWAAPPTIAILYPTGGQTFDTASYVITCSGTVTNGGDGYANLYLNGIFVQNMALDMTRIPPTFSTQLVLVSGSNQIQVSDTNADGTETATVTVTSTRIRNDLRVNMIWNDGASDVDLHLFCPGDSAVNVAAEHISWHHKTGANGGSLDVDNVDGYGPENISFPAGRAPHGTYVGAVNLYSRLGAQRDIGVRITIFLNEGTTSLATQILDTIVLTVPNAEADVATASDGPRNVNTNSTYFFTFDFAKFRVRPEKPAQLLSYPNPFRPGVSAAVTFQTDSGTVIDQVAVWTVEGRAVRTLPGNGTDAVTWDGRNAQGHLIASGIYFVVARLSSGRSAIGRMTLVR